MKLATLKILVDNACKHAKKTDTKVKFLSWDDEELRLQNVLQFEMIPEIKFLFKRKINFKKTKEN